MHYTMTDTETMQGPLSLLGHEILSINEQNGWNILTPQAWAQGDVYRIPAVLALIHSEVSEALEAYRNHGGAEAFGEECADILIRTLDLACGLGFDMDSLVRQKLEKNRTRGYRHGGKKV